MKKCCIVGGTGFIGSNLVKKIATTNRIVTVIGRKKEMNLNKEIVYLAGNCLNIQFMKKNIHLYNELIILSDFLHNYEKSIEYFRIKIENFFYMLLKSNIKRIIIASSGGAIYGEAKVIPIKEDFSKNPISNYGKEKLLIEEIGLSFFSKYKLPIIFIRPSNVYGDGQIPFTGQGFISTAIASIKTKKTINIYGTYGTVRDYIHVDDVVEAIICLLDYGLIGECYNIGTGIGLNNFEILSEIKKISLEENISINIQNERVTDNKVNILDCSKIFKHVNWKYKISIIDGLFKLWNAESQSSLQYLYH